VRDVFGLKVSKGRERGHGSFGVVSVTVQIGDALLLIEDMPFTVGDRLLCNGEVGQFYISIHGVLLKVAAAVKPVRRASGLILRNNACPVSAETMDNGCYG
jgi:hypothetical protein